MAKLLTLVLIGLSVGLSNFAASIAIGLSGVNKMLRLKIGLVFGLFETGMPIVGLLIGHRLASTLGGNANVLGGMLLVLTGAYAIFQALRIEESQAAVPDNMRKLLAAGLALSIDNLIVGFSLGTTKTSLPVAVLVIGITSVALSLIGLELGSRLKSQVEGYSELLSGAILVLVGLLVGFKIL